MNIRLKPPCKVVVAEHPDKPMYLRRVSIPNGALRAQGWKGLVAHVQNQNGTGLVEYRRLRPADTKHEPNRPNAY